MVGPQRPSSSTSSEQYARDVKKQRAEIAALKLKLEQSLATETILKMAVAALVDMEASHWNVREPESTDGAVDPAVASEDWPAWLKPAQDDIS